MAKGVELATGYVTLAVETSDVGSAIGKRFAKVEGLAATTGDKAGKAMAKAFEKAKPLDTDALKEQQVELQKQVERSEVKIRQSKEKSARDVEAASRKVEIAEAKVAEARQKNEARAEQVARAEQELTAARERGEQGTKDFERLESALERARNAAGTPTSRLMQLEDQLSTARQKAEAATKSADSQNEKYTRELEVQRRELAQLGDEMNRAERETEGTGNAFQRLGRRMGDSFKNRDWKTAFRRIEEDGESTANKLEREFDRSGHDSGSKFGGGFTRAFGGAVAGLGALVGISELFEFGGKAFTGSAALQQSVGAVETVFKDASGTMLQFGEDADQTLGMSANSYNELATLLGTQLRNAGVDDFAEQTNELIGLGADFSALFGGTAPDAVAAISSALKGERDPIEKYGVSLKQASIDAKAAELGFSKVGGTYDQNAQAAATLALITEQSTDAQGAFEREAGTTANTMQKLKAYFEDSSAALGDKLRPAFDKVGGWLLDKGIPAIESFGTSLESLGNLLFKGEFDGKLFGLEEDSPFVGFLFNVREGLLGIWDSAKDWIGSEQGQEFFGKMRDAGEKLWNDVLKPFGTWFMEEAPKYLPTLAKLAGAFVALAAVIVGLGLGVVIAQTLGTIGVVVGVVWPVLKFLVDWIVNTGWPALKAAFKAIGDAAVWLYENALKPAWDGILATIDAVVTWVRDSAVPWFQSAWDAIADAAVWLWQNVFSPVWEGIKVAVAVAVTAVLVVMDALVWVWQHTVAPVLQWLNERVVQPVWAAIQKAIAGVVAWFQNTAWPVLAAVIGWVTDRFNWLRDKLGAAWSWVKDRVINPVVTWFRDVAWPVLQSVAGSVVDRFNWLRDKLRDVWSFIKDRVIAPVANWFEDTIQPMFDRVTGGVGDAFETLEDTVGRVWNGIKDKAKAPVKFVVEDIVRDGIVKKYNDVAETFGAKTVDESKFTVGWAAGGILPGFTPRHRGDDVLTPMRSGEGVLVSEGLRDRRSQQAFLGANEAAKRGVPFSRFLEQGYAGGGLVKLRMPFNGSYPQGDGFGARGGRHKGVDWPMPSGAVLRAVGAGVVSHSRNAAAGNKLELALGKGLVAGYHHLSAFTAANGASVGTGASVGRVGSTGRSSGPHLHFSLKRDGSYVNPLPFLGAGGAAGTGDGGGGLWNPLQGLWDELKDRVRAGVGDSDWGDVMFGFPKKVVSDGLSFLTEKASQIGDWAVDSVTTGAKATRWSPLATRALTKEGVFSPLNLASMLRRMEQESGFNPRAVNNWDSNARRGTPSKGLMQVIGPTFKAFAHPDFNKDIFDPFSNMLASVRYTKSTYPSLRAGWDRPGGYKDGGITDLNLFDSGGVMEHGTAGFNLSGKPEAVLDGEETKTYREFAEALVDGRAAGGDVNVYVQSRENEDPYTSGRKVADVLDFRGIRGRISGRA